MDSVWSADPGGDLTYTLTGLTNGTSYDVQVRAVNAGFDGEWSATVTATPMAGLSAADPTQVLPDWALTPTGLEVGDQFRLLFVSSGTRNAESADIGVYNTFVRNQANGGHADIRPLAGQFKALISTGAVDARDNTGTHPNADIPIYWLSGDKAADDYADLYDGGWDSNAGRYQDGSAVGTLGERVWTGSQSDGTQSNRPTANVVVTVGFTNVSGKEIDSQADDDKSDDRKLYGLSPVFTVVGAPTAPRDVLAWSGDTELGVSWRTPANSGGTPVSFYDLRHRPTTDDDSGTWTEVDSVWSADPGGDLTYTLTGLTNGTSYDVQVRAVNAGFDGEWSATVTATPMAGLSAADPTQVLPDWALTPRGWKLGTGSACCS